MNPYLLICWWVAFWRGRQERDRVIPLHGSAYVEAIRNYDEIEIRLGLSSGCPERED